MNQDVLAYIVTGGILIGGGIPLVALLIRNIRESKKLDEVKRPKKQVTEPLEPEDVHALM